MPKYIVSFVVTCEDEFISQNVFGRKEITTTDPIESESNIARIEAEMRNWGSPDPDITVTILNFWEIDPETGKMKKGH